MTQYDDLIARLEDVNTPVDLFMFADAIEAIKVLQRERNALRAAFKVLADESDAWLATDTAKTLHAHNRFDYEACVKKIAWMRAMAEASTLPPAP